MSLDLRTGCSVWLLNDETPVAHPPLEQDLSTEVAIVGAGISGALIAHALTERGMDVVMVDRREVCAGSTTASTAILSYETDGPLSDHIVAFGPRAGARVYQAGSEALRRLEDLAETLDDDCGFHRTATVYFASRRTDASSLREEYGLRIRHGFDARFLTREEFEKRFSFSAPCAILNPDSAIVDPVRLTRALVRRAEAKGAQVFGHTVVKNYVRSRGTSALWTADGHRIRAKHVVFASGYETQQILKQRTVRLVSSYAMATQRVPKLDGWYKRSTIWESARPCLYMRVTPDDRIVAGGEDVNFVDEDKRDALLAKKARVIERKLRRMFPAISIELATAWTGTFAETKDGLPYIGPHPKFPGALFALGYGGNGITFATVASQIIPDLIRKKKNPDAQIFGFGR